MIPLPYKLLALALTIMALAAAVLGYGHHQYVKGTTVQQAVDQKATDKLKLEAAAELAAEKDKTSAKEQALQDFVNKQELKDAEHKKLVDSLAGQLRAAAGSIGRLRDPNATPGCRLGSSGAPGKVATVPGSGSDNGAEAGGLFSEPATRLFERLTREADDINAAYQSCRDYASKVTEPTP